MAKLEKFFHLQLRNLIGFECDYSIGLPTAAHGRLHEICADYVVFREYQRGESEPAREWYVPLDHLRSIGRMES